MAGIGGRGLTVREADALAAVRAHFAATGRPPYAKEIGERIGVGQSQTYDLLRGCARAGFLEIAPRRGKRTEIRLRNRLCETSTEELVEELAARMKPLSAHPGNDPEYLAPALAA